MTTVVGLDLSLTATGVARIVDGVPSLMTIKSKTKGTAIDAQVARFAGIRREVLRLCADADLVLVEGPSYGSKGSAVHQIAGNWWLIVNELMACGYAVGVAAPSVAKKFGTGRGNADKTAMAIGMARLWPDLTPANDNEVDALTIATMAGQKLRMPDLPTRSHHAAALTSVAWPTLPIGATTP